MSMFKSGRVIGSVVLLLLGYMLCPVQATTLAAQGGSELTANAALEMMQQDAGKWSGMQTNYGDDGEADTEKTKVVVVNRIEGGKWLYFQIAEKVGSEVQYTKGTLEFDPAESQLVRRWFDSGSAEINRATVNFDAESKALSFSTVVPGTTPEPAVDDFAAFDSPAATNDIRVTTVLSARDKDTRVARVYEAEMVEGADDVLVSELVLTRATVKGSASAKAKAPTKGSTAAKAKTSNVASQPQKTKKAEPVTHVLQVTVFVGSSRLETGQEPDLVITPDEGVKRKRLDADTFEFTGLKAGEEYSVSGSYKLTTGLGVTTAGKTSAWKIEEDSPRKRTATRNLKLQ